MPIDLRRPIAWKNANRDELLMLQSLQGNILKNHGRHFTGNIFFALDSHKQREMRRLLCDLANFHLTSAYRQLLEAETFKETKVGGGPFAHLALSAAGYTALGRDDAAPRDPDFRKGMKDAASVKDLGDPAVSAWEPNFQKKIDGVIIAAHETASKTGALIKSIRELIEDAGGTVLFVQHGAAIFDPDDNGIEHFGYVDGRSLPLMLQEDIDLERAATGTLHWDPAFPVGIALVPDPGGATLPPDPKRKPKSSTHPETLDFGSYLVFRKLEQMVRAFKTREQIVADALGLTGDDRELAGAMIVGRFEDGTPVTLSKTARGGKPPNDFDYNSDPGIRCPFHAHVRKTNPRGSAGIPGGEATERGTIMPRRAIPYEDARREVQPSELPDAKDTASFLKDVAPLLPEKDVGLLFMAYNSSIERQFKTTQMRWANETDFPLVPKAHHGLDPVIGQGHLAPGEQKLPNTWNDPSKGTNDKVDFSGFVKMKGGEYFFSPSLTFLRNL